MEDWNAAGWRSFPRYDDATADDDDRPTLPYAEVKTLPRGVAVLAPPGFDVSVATPWELDVEMLRFFAKGEAHVRETEARAAALQSDVDAEEASVWWNAQRQRTLRGCVATVMALCAAVLAAGVR